MSLSEPTTQDDDSPRLLSALWRGLAFMLLLLVLIPGGLYLACPPDAYHFRSVPLGVAGALLLVSGIGVICLCCREFLRGQGTPVPGLTPSRLVTTGVYRLSRNPMYLAYVAIALSEALILGRPGLLIYSAVVFVGLQLRVWGFEEPALRARFGVEFDEYCRRVPRWLPWPGRTVADA